MAFKSPNLSVLAKWLVLAIIFVVAAVGAPRLHGPRIVRSQGPQIHLKQTLRTAGTEYSTLRKMYSRQSDSEFSTR